MKSSKGNSKSSSKNPADWNKFDFVEIRLDDKQKAEFKSKYSKDGQSLLALLDETVKNGYKLSIGYDTNNNCVIASLTCREPNDTNFNYVMTSRAADCWEATALAMYKHHFVVDDNDWGGDTRESRDTWG